MKFLSIAQMVAVEREANAGGLTYPMMMDNAGQSLAETVAGRYGHLPVTSICGLVGSGNNGGDTLVALAHLAQNGWQATACLVRPRQSDDPLLVRLASTGGQIIAIDGAGDFPVLRHVISTHKIILDGVLGTGIRLPLKIELADLLGFVQAEIELMDAPPLVVAVDCPSGVDCDSGRAAPQTIPADLTVTMAAVKHGLLKFPAYNLVGDLRVVGIGLPGDGEDLASWRSLPHFVVDQTWVKSVLPARPADSHKGTFGTALVVAGSLAYTGAAWLAGQAAYRSGAGLVTMAVPTPLHSALAGHFPEATWLLLPEKDGFIIEEAAHLVLANLERVTALLLGPGFGLHSETGRFLDLLFQANPAPNTLPAVVIDADGLKLLAQIDRWPACLPPNSVLTPHPGEMAVLTGLSKAEIQADRLEIALRFSQQWGHIVVLKGAFTLITDPGGRAAIIPVASAALARAGTGDILAGIIAGLCAQGLDSFTAAAAGAWIHAQAGLRAANLLGNSAAVLAGDVLDGVVTVLGELG